MDSEMSGEILDASAPLQPEVEKLSISNIPEESTELEKLPAGDEKPPAGDEKLPAGDEKPPAVDEKPPAVDEKPPAGDEKPPAVDEKPPAVDEKPPAVDEKPPAVDEMTEHNMEPDESSEKLCDTVPEKLAESVPEAELQEQTLPEPAVLQHPVDVQPPSSQEKDAEQVVTETEMQTPMATEAEEAEGAAECEAVKSEDTVPAPGSLAFALLEQEWTKDALRTSRILIILRGLPGSGKSFLASAIADAYKDHCTVISADDHGVNPENPESSVDGYKALDEAVVACCSAGTASSLLMVVDDSNHTQDRLARLGEIAEEHNLVAVFLEPCTEWCRDVAQLTKKTKRGLEEAQVEAMRGQFEEMSLPLFFGWFLLSSVQGKVRCSSMDFLKTLDTLDAFKEHLIDFDGKAEEVDLEEYFKSKGTLHCTTKFCDYGKAEGSKEYAQNPSVKDSYGSVSELSLTALFVTPRTFGARVSLTEEQLLLWPADAEEEAQPTVSLPLGSRAHVTLGCADGVEPVQTGLDLLEILLLQQEAHQGQLVVEMGLGSLTYYGEGRWLLHLREPICAPACFSSFYGRKELTTKNPLKKKKAKCTVL